MSTVQNIHIFFANSQEEPATQAAEETCTSYSIDVRAGEDWIVTGKYRDNSLCALELKRISQTEAKE
jgi:hypothetical protein